MTSARQHFFILVSQSLLHVSPLPVQRFQARLNARRTGCVCLPTSSIAIARRAPWGSEVSDLPSLCRKDITSTSYEAPSLCNIFQPPLASSLFGSDISDMSENYPSVMRRRVGWWNITNISEEPIVSIFISLTLKI